MNANQTINMVIRLLIRKGVNQGIKAGLNHMSRRGESTGKVQTNPKDMKQKMRLMRRVAKF